VSSNNLQTTLSQRLARFASGDAALKGALKMCLAHVAARGTLHEEFRVKEF